LVAHCQACLRSDKQNIQSLSIDRIFPRFAAEGKPGGPWYLDLALAVAIGGSYPPSPIRSIDELGRYRIVRCMWACGPAEWESDCRRRRRRAWTHAGRIPRRGIPRYLCARGPKAKRHRRSPMARHDVVSSSMQHGQRWTRRSLSVHLSGTLRLKRPHKQGQEGLCLATLGHDFVRGAVWPSISDTDCVPGCPFGLRLPQRLDTFFFPVFSNNKKCKLHRY
jgi:hypothetical protein